MTREILCEAAKQKLLNGEPIGRDINYVAGEIHRLYYRPYIESLYSDLKNGRQSAATIADIIYADTYEQGRFKARARLIVEALYKILN